MNVPSNTRSSRREEALIRCGTRNVERGIRSESLLTSAATSWWIVALALLGFAAIAQENSTPIRFNTVDVFVDAGTQPLAAYQLSFTATSGDVKIVGIEGGEHPAFREPPYYDPLAIQHERAILAAFNTASADRLPKGRTRVAIVHVQITGARTPVYAVKLEAAANQEGSRVVGQASFQERNGP